MLDATKLGTDGAMVVAEALYLVGQTVLCLILPGMGVLVIEPVFSITCLSVNMGRCVMM